jgi:hypothetical protein
VTHYLSGQYVSGQMGRAFTRSARRFVVAGVAAITLGLAGCETSSSLLGGGDSAPTQVSAAPAAPTQNRVSVAPVIGAPDGVAKQLQQSFASAIGQKNVTVVAAQDKADYALRGYVVAAKDKAGTKVSYIWDVTDTSGRRVNRVTGEEVVAGTATDPWANVTPQVTQSIAQKSADSVATWMSQNTQAAVAAAPQAASATSPTSVGALPAATATPATTPPAATAAAPAPAKTATAAPQPLQATIPTLSGAPGDGNSALAAALQAELSKSGVPIASAGATAYRVEGVVKLGAATDGKQPVQIDWNVKDPAGKRLGTVTQKNEVAAGSLDSSWGKTADAAASAAAQGILKLLPRQVAAN